MEGMEWKLKRMEGWNEGMEEPDGMKWNLELEMDKWNKYF